MTGPEEPKSGNAKIVISGLLALFLAPLLIAVAMRSSWWDFKPAGFANRGILVEPVRALPIDSLELQYAPPEAAEDTQPKWVLLYPIPGTCDHSCREDFTSLRQIHIASGRHRHEVSIWLLSEQETATEVQKALVNIYPEFRLLADTAGLAGGLLAGLDGSGKPQQTIWDSRQAFLLDPATNIILRYPPNFDPGDLNQDLDRLLKWSGKD